MKTNLTSVLKVLLSLLAISLIVLFSSCSAKKTNTTENSEAQKVETAAETDTKKVVESNVKVEEKKIVDDKNETVIKETTYEPIDNSKPASITDPDGRKTDLTNSKKTTREIVTKNNTKTDVAKSAVGNHKSEASTKSKSGTKSEAKKEAESINIDRKAWSSLNLLWLLIPLGLLIAWLNKTKIITWAKNIWWI